MDYEHIKNQDSEVFATLEGEEHREAEGLELIPSENYVSKAVREANGSCLTNKYSEGYPVSATTAAKRARRGFAHWHISHEQFFRSFDGKRFHLIGVRLAAVVALTGIAFGIFVGEA